MNFPLKKDLKILNETIKKLKDLEISRNSLDQETFSKLIENKISIKEYLEKTKNISSNSKKIDQKAKDLFIEYNNIFSKIITYMGYKKTKKYILKQKNFFEKVFKKKENPIIKEKNKIENIKKIEKPKRKKNIFSNLFKKKIEIIGVNTIEKPEPIFEVPKELLPENYQVLIKGFSYAFVNEENGDKVYFVAEPELNKKEVEILEQTKNELINKISITDLNNESQMYTLIDKIFKKNNISLEKVTKDKIVYYIIRQVSGLDRIEPLMHDNLIEDIECNGMNSPIYIVHRKYGHIVTNIMFHTEKELQDFIIKMAHLSKSYVSYASPLLDSILPDGSRVNATLTSNVSTRGPTFTIRKFPQKPLTTIDLVKSKTITSTIVAYLWTLIEFKKNIILIGPTAGGKTTLLNVISSFIPSAQRVVSIEDTREINLLMDNWIPQVTRPGFGPPDSTGKRYGEINMEDLLKESFRQRPDYLIIGEVRGVEMALMFQGMASGHSSLSTVHSKSLESLIIRLTTPPISLDPSLITSLDAVIITGFTGTGNLIKREVKEIDEVRNYNTITKKVEYNILYKSSQEYKDNTMTGKSDLFTKDIPLIYNSDLIKEIAEEHNLKRETIYQLVVKRKEFIESLIPNPPKDYIEFKKIINNYKKTENVDI
ncbi:MAG: type II/IV secretion system ATPase subunit [Candidatus ainarchaeum sp.]|nr:type II/IV secretion system ATPase subunit [Candidatus ainarchaeum sp.]